MLDNGRGFSIEWTYFLPDLYVHIIISSQFWILGNGYRFSVNGYYVWETFMRLYIPKCGSEERALATNE